MLLNIKYSALQLGYWMDYLLISSFGTVLLLDRGFGAAEVGYSTTAGAVLAIVLQTYTSSLADRSLKVTVKQILIALIIGCMAFGGFMMLFSSSHALTFICMFMAFGITASLSPLLTALCLKYNKAGYDVNYGIARSLGSFGYAFAGFMAGRITAKYGISIILPVFLIIYALVLIILFSMKDTGTTAESEETQNEDTDAEASSLLSFFKKYPVYDIFLVAVMMIFFMQMVLGTYMIYFVRAYGGGEAEMGLALSLAAFAEMPAVALGMYFLKKHSAGTLLRVTAITSVVKFTAMIFITDVRVFIALQLLHFFYSGMYMVSSVYFADDVVSRTDAVKAQGILAMGISGVAGTIANISAGYMLEHLTVRFVSVVGASVAAAGMVLMFVATGIEGRRKGKEKRKE